MTAFRDKCRLLKKSSLKPLPKICSTNPNSTNFNSTNFHSTKQFQLNFKIAEDNFSSRSIVKVPKIPYNFKIAIIISEKSYFKSLTLTPKKNPSACPKKVNSGFPSIYRILRRHLDNDRMRALLTFITFELVAESKTCNHIFWKKKWKKIIFMKFQNKLKS